MLRDKIIAFFLRYPIYFKQSISEHFPFTKDQLFKYKDFLYWGLVSWNTNILWTQDLIFEFQDLLVWRSFSLNPKAFKDKSLIDIFSDKIQWKVNDRNNYYRSIAANEGIRWDLETIEKYASKIDFETLSANRNVDWSETLLDKYRYKWDFERLSDNDTIPWTLELFEKYLHEDFINKDQVFEEFIGSCIMINETLINYELVEKYKDILEWHFISRNGKLPWKEKNLFEHWSEYIDWAGIAQNEFLFREDPNFYHKNYDKWQINKLHCIHSFCYNNAFPWTVALIEKYKDSIVWDSLCANTGIAWDIDLINHFSEYVQWGGLFPSYEYDIEKKENVLVEGSKLVKTGLIENKSIPWSIDFLEYFETKLTPELLRDNSAIWEKAFKPLVDEKVIDEVFDRFPN